MSDVITLPESGYSKPAGLTPEHAAQFDDASVVKAYALREPYGSEISQLLAELSPRLPARILELGCGTGDLTLGLVEMASNVAAVDVSTRMIAAAQQRLSAPQVKWLCGAAEQVALPGPFDLVIAGDSVHWMDWSILFARVKGWLSEGGKFCVVTRSYVNRQWWTESLQTIIDTYSTNREFQPYDLIAELDRSGLVQIQGTRTTSVLEFKQSVSQLIEAFHSRNGLSRERMGEPQAYAFDQALSEHLRSFASGDGLLDLGSRAQVTWMVPR